MRFPRGFARLCCATAGLLVLEGCGRELATNGGLGDPCLHADDCTQLPADLRLCLSAAPQGYCSVACSEDRTACVAVAGECISFPTTEHTDGVCLRACSADTDCADGIACRPVAGLPDDVSDLCAFDALDEGF